MDQALPASQRGSLSSSNLPVTSTTRSDSVVESCYKNALNQIPKDQLDRFPSERVELLSPFPDELWIRILSHLPPEKLIHLQGVCKGMQRLAQNESLWGQVGSRLDPPMVLVPEQSPTRQYKTYLRSLQSPPLPKLLCSLLSICAQIESQKYWERVRAGASTSGLYGRVYTGNANTVSQPSLERIGSQETEPNEFEDNAGA